MAEDVEKKEEPIAEKSAEQVKQEELNERVNTFIKEYGQLVLKHKIDFASYPMFMPDGQGGFKIICQNTPVDIGNQPLKSPFVTKE